MSIVILKISKKDPAKDSIQTFFLGFAKAAKSLPSESKKSNSQRYPY